MNENDSFNDLNEIILYHIFDSLKMIFLDFFLIESVFLFAALSLKNPATSVVSFRAVSFNYSG